MGDERGGPVPEAWRAALERSLLGSTTEPPTAFIIETPAGQFVVLVHGMAPDLTQLTLSERQIHQLVMEGCSNDEIARRRDVSKRTVVNQLMSIYRKLGVRSRRELKAQFRGGRS